jgi:hypothetical protein
VDDDGEDIKMLMITLMKRPVTDEEREWKKSKRMDNQDKKRIDRRNAKVRRAFEPRLRRGRERERVDLVGLHGRWKRPCRHTHPRCGQVLPLNTRPCYAQTGGADTQGVRFFEDDEDYFNLEDMLQALCFLEAGEAWVPAKPWDVYHFPYATDKMATDVNALSKGAREQLNRMLEVTAVSLPRSLPPQQLECVRGSLSVEHRRGSCVQTRLVGDRPAVLWDATQLHSLRCRRRDQSFRVSE